MHGVSVSIRFLMACFVQSQVLTLKSSPCPEPAPPVHLDLRVSFACRGRLHCCFLRLLLLYVSTIRIIGFGDFGLGLLSNIVISDVACAVLICNL